MIRCRGCGFDMALNLSMTFDEQTARGCPSCGLVHEWWTGLPAPGGPWSANDWRLRFEEQRAAFTAARQASE